MNGKAPESPGDFPLPEGTGHSLARGLLRLLIFALLTLLILFTLRHLAGLAPPTPSAPAGFIHQPVATDTSASPGLVVTEDTQRVDTAKGDGSK